MKLTRPIDKLKIAIDPYLFFWDEWANDENCTLTKAEVDFTNNLIKTDFKWNGFNSTISNAEIEFIANINKKLEIGYGVFKEFIVADFLYTLKKLGEAYPDGHEYFLKAPIDKLNISEEIKTALLNFKVHTIGLIFVFYKLDELRSGLLYKHIVDVLIAKKNEKILLT